jgi:hypothetical protein
MESTKDGIIVDIAQIAAPDVAEQHTTPVSIV